MIKIQIKGKFDGKIGEYKEFTVYLRFTDGIEPVLVTNNFSNVLDKIKAIQQAIHKQQIKKWNLYKGDRMVRRYIKTILNEQGIDYTEDRNSFIIDCGGNDMDFIKMINIISTRMETWTYELELCLNIKIDTGYEKITIKYWEDC